METLAQVEESVRAWLWGLEPMPVPQHKRPKQHRRVRPSQEARHGTILVFVTAVPVGRRFRYRFTVPLNGRIFRREGDPPYQFKFSGAYNRGVKEAKRWARANVPGAKVEIQAPRLVKHQGDYRRVA